MSIAELRHALKATRDLLEVINNTIDNCTSQEERVLLMMEREELYMELDFINDDLLELETKTGE